MANTKISAFTAETDVANITGFAAYKTVSGSSTNVRISGSEIESTLNLSNFAVGTLAVDRGGTGATTFTANGILIGNTTSAISATAELANGELLIGSTGNAPSPATLTAGADITITNANGSITIANAAPNQATPAAGSSGQLQYNDGSNGFAASTNLVYATDTLTVQDNIVIKGDGSSDASKLRFNCWNNNHYVDLIGPDHSNNPLSYSITLPNKIATQSPVSQGRILEVNGSGVGNWIATPTDTNTSIYSDNGSLTGARIVTMGSHNLSFASTTAGQEVKFGQNVRIDGQSYTPLETISSTTSWTPDWDSGNVQTMELQGNTTINNPSNIEVGATYIIILKQDAEGSHTVTWGNAYNFPGATPPTLTTGANKADVITLVAYSSTVLMCTSVLDFETT